ncbi:MAG: GNAT family N-acetyltransferase [Actinomycetota bacterium]|nr:GNAT family N-acetyltransferase [Actinomycetota bacterium]
MTEFPAGYTLRELTEADAHAAAELLNAAGEVDGSPRALTAADVDEVLRLLTARVVEGPEGELAGYFDIFIEPERGFLDTAVHPNARGRGVGTAMLQAAESLARKRLEHDDGALLRSAIAGKNEGGRKLHEAQGYSYVRSFFRMEAELDSRPDEPEWPEGLAVRQFQPGDERLLYDCLRDAFLDHWEGDRQLPFERWSKFEFDEITFRPAATFIVFDHDEPTAGVLSAHRFGMGWIGSLGVRRAWRKQGLGLGLLRRAFGVLYDEGERKVGLGVDAENTTGATRLYERAGMHVAARFDTFQKQVTER